MLTSIMTRSAIVVLLCALSIPAHAVADNSVKHSINIAAQDLSSALEELSHQSGTDLVYRPEQVRGLKTGGAVGEMTTQDAVVKLLQGTRLKVSEDASGALLIAAPLSTASGGQSFPGTPDSQPNQPRSSLQLAQATSGQTSSDASVSVGSDQKTSEAEKRRKQAEQLQEVVVIGTHIHETANPTAPMIVIDGAEIERSGYTTVGQLVTSLPQNFGGGTAGATPDGFLGTGNQRLLNSAYGTGINLRGLGAGSTLVLLNGHRLAPSADGTFVDVSMIPLAAIDRVEIMTDGASAIYGSEAVAGVVNFVLRKDYQGQETRLSYGSGTDGTLPQTLAEQTVGRDWTTGNFVISGQYQKQGALSAADRSYTATSPAPTDLLPKSEQYSGLVNLRQDLPYGFDVAADVLYSHAELSAYKNGFYITHGAPTTNDGVATVSLGYRPAETWHIQASGSYGVMDETLATTYMPQAIPACGSGPCFNDEVYRIGSGELIADGTLLRLPGGDAKMAIGGSYRNEIFSNTAPQTPIQDLTFDRHVTAEFAELQVPIVGRGNAISGIQGVDLSLALRHDQYSDFGGTTNPRYGLSWKPFDGLNIRGSYSTAFQAPTAYQETKGVGLFNGQPFIDEEDFPSASGGMVPVFLQVSRTPSLPPLQPQLSRNWMGGIDLQPSNVPNLTFSVDYFDIRYKDQIGAVSFPASALSQLNVYGGEITQFSNDAAALAYLSAFTAAGGLLFDDVGTNGVGVRYLFKEYEQNIALTRTNGADLVANYRFSAKGNDFRAAVNVAYVNQILTSFVANATPTNLVNTYSNPLRWRGRGEFGWSRGRLALNTAVNVSGSYVDTTTVGDPPIASWTTVDAQLTYTAPIAKQLTLSLAVTNILNRDPPYVVGTDQFARAVHYDVGNGNPFGRVAVLSARLAW